MKVPSPAILVETLGGYSAAAALIFVGLKGGQVLPHVLGENPWPTFWLVGLLPWFGALLWIWVSVYLAAYAYRHVKLAAGSLIAIVAAATMFLIGGVSSFVAFVVIIVEFSGYLTK
ncbi:hypothetical protein [Epibacterium ulvae]|uniref:hypothetical protein n=1 Tax=Epibacterium ulvae TaxID=1156985 RepID=UPI000B7D302F|nr:hypothetical protein [Epibacterium ulvae]